MTLQDVLQQLRGEIEAAGSAKAWAERHAISPSYVSDVLKGVRDPGPAVLEALRLERVVTYRGKAA